MPLIGSYSFGSASADRYSTVDELLSQLPDNTANLIAAQDIRDSVYTLWKNIEDVSIVAASAASASAFFYNPNPTPITVGGITAGSTFVTPTDMQTMWNLLLYPYVAPAASIQLTSTLPYYNNSGVYVSSGGREYGAPLSVNLSWSVIKNSNPITSIIVAGFTQVPNGNSQSGSQVTFGTHSVSPGVSQTNTFNMSVSDGISTTNASTTLTWMNRRYWGSVDLSGIGNPDLTLNPGLSSSVAAFVTNGVILSLNGANANSQAFGNELSTTKSKTYVGINGAGKHLVFAWPSNVSNPYTPTFTVNGLPNTAFTRIRSNSPFVNQYGFTTNYEVWVSNTLQNSPLNIVIS
jgi:hypothetical protein